MARSNQRSGARALAAIAAVAASAAGAESTHPEDETGMHPAVGVFAGATTLDDETDFTMGVELELRFLDGALGVGPIYEFTPGGHHGEGFSVLLGALHWHPWRGLRLSGGAGAEAIHEGSTDWEALFRAGAAYDIHLGPISLAPSVSVDFVDDEEAVVFGLVISKSF